MENDTPSDIHIRLRIEECRDEGYPAISSEVTRNPRTGKDLHYSLDETVFHRQRELTFQAHAYSYKAGDERHAYGTNDDYNGI